MKTQTTTSSRGSKHADQSRNPPLNIEIVRSREGKKHFDRILEREHYLGEGRPVGDYLRQVAVREGEWVGLLTWGAACYALKDRDEYIGWTPTLRAERQKLIVQNRRFLLLSEAGSEPNLASQVLGAAVRTLPLQWQECFGYEPLAAETFTDIEAFKGTCYRAAGWIPIGMSKGYSRHRADFYVPNKHPKKLWIKPLRTQAFETLCAAELPEVCRGGAQSNAHGVLPLKTCEIESLHEALCRTADPRGKNRTFSLGAVLSIVAMAMLSGHRDISAIQRFGQRLTQPQRKALGLPRKKGAKFIKTPGYKVYYNLLAQLDTDAFAQVLSGWLSEKEGSLPGALALDGKMVRDTIGVVSLVDTETGTPRAMRPMSMKEGEGERCEIKAAQRLIKSQSDLSGQLVSADALHAQHRTVQAVVERGGNYLVQIKNNQKTIRKTLEKKARQFPPLFAEAKKGTDGRSGDASVL